MLLHHLQDHPWWTIRIGGMSVTLMSSAIVTMILVGLLLPAIIIPIARRYRISVVPHGSANALELLVVFVRDMIAKPALRQRAYDFLPLLCTMFVFVLAMNLTGLLPLGAVAELANLPPIGATPTSIPTVCGSLAALSFVCIVGLGLKATALRYHEHHRWPLALAVALSPLLWIRGLAPSIPGMVGYLLLVPLALLELVGMVAKCFSLMVRLLANIMAGHALLAALMMFVAMVTADLTRETIGQAVGISAACILGSVLVNLLEMLVAGLQAYIFTFLTAMFIGLYVEPDH
ncbi:MAG: F0F1 ATP synthase subunit A [Phycisphaerae bacterium]